MSVLIVTRWYVPEWKACTIRAMYFVKALLDKGFNVTVLIPKYPHEKIRNCSIYSEKLVQVSFISLSRRLALEPLTPVISTINMLKCLREVFDVVIATVPPHDVAYIAWYLKKLGVAKELIIDIRDVISTTSAISSLYSYYLPTIQTHMSLLGIHFFHKILSKTYHVITVTHGVTEYYKTIVNGNFYTIYNGADYKLFSKYTRSKESSYPILGVFVGDVEARYHLIDVMFKVLALLKKKGVKVKLRIIGCSDRMRESYSILAKDLGILRNIELVGIIPYFKLPRYLRDGIFGIVGRPNVIEWKLTIPVKVYEYIACGLPVFAFGPPRSELQFFIESFGVGVYVPSTDPQVLAKELAKFIKDIDKFDRNHILRVAKLFDRKKWAKRFADIISSVLYC